MRFLAKPCILLELELPQVACRNLKEASPERDDLEFRAMMIYKHIIICQQVTTVGRSDK